MLPLKSTRLPRAYLNYLLCAIDGICGIVRAPVVFPYAGYVAYLENKIYIKLRMRLKT